MQKGWILSTLSPFHASMIANSFDPLSITRGLFAKMGVYCRNNNELLMRNIYIYIYIYIYMWQINAKFRPIDFHRTQRNYILAANTRVRLSIVFNMWNF